MKPERPVNQGLQGNNWNDWQHLQIADLRIDRQLRTVTALDNAEHFTDLSWRFLMTLIRAWPEPASTELLAEKVWQQTHVTDEAIAQRVRQIRRALGDDSKVPKYIRTIRGQGYQLIPKPEPIVDSTSDSPRRPAWRAVLPTLLVAAVLFGTAYWTSSLMTSRIEEPAGGSSVESADESSRPSKTEELLNRAREYRHRGNRDGNDFAVEIYQQILAEQPDNVSALIGLSAAFSHRPSKYGQSLEWADQAEQLADRALLLAPDRGAAWSVRGFADDVRGRTRSAMSYYERALELEPDNPSGLSSLAYLKLITGQLHDGLTLEARALQSPVKPYFSDMQIATALDIAGLGQLAEPWWQRVVQLRPDNVFLDEHLARRHFLRGRYQQALQIVQSDTAERYELLKLKGVILLAMEQIPASTEAFKQSQRLAEQNDRSCYACMAELFVREKTVTTEQLTHKLEVAKDAVKRGESWPWFRVEVAYLELALGDPESAMGSLREAVELGYRDWRWLQKDPLLTELNSRNDFADLIADIKTRVDEQRIRILEDPALMRALDRHPDQ